MKNTLKKLVCLTLVLCAAMMLLCNSALAAGSLTASPKKAMTFKVTTKAAPFAIAPCLTMRPVAHGWTGNKNDPIRETCWGYYSVSIKTVSGKAPSTTKISVWFWDNNSSQTIYLRPGSTYKITVTPHIAISSPAKFRVTGSSGVKSIK